MAEAQTVRERAKEALSAGLSKEAVERDLRRLGAIDEGGKFTARADRPFDEIKALVQGGVRPTDKPIDITGEGETEHDPTKTQFPDASFTVAPAYEKYAPAIQTAFEKGTKAPKVSRLRQQATRVAGLPPEAAAPEPAPPEQARELPRIDISGLPDAAKAFVRQSRDPKVADRLRKFSEVGVDISDPDAVWWVGSLGPLQAEQVLPEWKTLQASGVDLSDPKALEAALTPIKKSEVVLRKEEPRKGLSGVAKRVVAPIPRTAGAGLGAMRSIKGPLEDYPRLKTAVTAVTPALWPSAAAEKLLGKRGEHGKEERLKRVDKELRKSPGDEALLALRKQIEGPSISEGMGHMEDDIHDRLVASSTYITSREQAEAEGVGGTIGRLAKVSPLGGLVPGSEMGPYDNFMSYANTGFDAATDVKDLLLGLADMALFPLGLDIPDEELEKGFIDFLVSQFSGDGAQYGQMLASGMIGGVGAILANPMDALETRPLSLLMTLHPVLKATEPMFAKTKNFGAWQRLFGASEQLVSSLKENRLGKYWAPFREKFLGGANPEPGSFSAAVRRTISNFLDQATAEREVAFDKMIVDSQFTDPKRVKGIMARAARLYERGELTEADLYRIIERLPSLKEVPVEAPAAVRPEVPRPQPPPIPDDGGAALMAELESIGTGRRPRRPGDPVPQRPTPEAAPTAQPTPGGAYPWTPEKARRNTIFNELAGLQRGKPETLMGAIQESKISQLYGHVAEHTGDIINRMAKELEFVDSPYGQKKIQNMLRTLEPGFMREVREQIASNLAYNKARGRKVPSVEAAEAELRVLGKEYAKAHRELPVYNEAQKLANDAAIAVGEFRFDDARTALRELNKYAKDDALWRSRATAIEPEFFNKAGSRRSSGFTPEDVPERLRAPEAPRPQPPPIPDDGGATVLDAKPRLDARKKAAEKAEIERIEAFEREWERSVEALPPEEFLPDPEFAPGDDSVIQALLEGEHMADIMDAESLAETRHMFAEEALSLPETSMRRKQLETAVQRLDLQDTGQRTPATMGHQRVVPRAPEVPRPQPPPIPEVDPPRKFASSFSGGGTVEAVLGPKTKSVFAEEFVPEHVEHFNKSQGTKHIPTDIKSAKAETLKAVEADHYAASPVCHNVSKAKRNATISPDDLAFGQAVADRIVEAKTFTVSVENVPKYVETVPYKNITDTLTKEGYTWDAVVHDAADYGAPMERKRVVVRAVKEGELPPMPKKQPPGDWYEVIKDLIDDAPDAPFGKPRKKGRTENWEVTRLRKMIEDGKLDPEKPIITMGGSAGKNAHARNAGGPAPTLKSTPKEVVRILMPDGRIKRLTPRMMARLMGLPDTYPVPDSYHLAKTIIGNGIHGATTKAFIKPLVDMPRPKLGAKAKPPTIPEVEATLIPEAKPPPIPRAAPEPVARGAATPLPEELPSSMLRPPPPKPKRPPTKLERMPVKERIDQIHAANRGTGASAARMVEVMRLWREAAKHERMDVALEIGLLKRQLERALESMEGRLAAERKKGRSSKLTPAQAIALDRHVKDYRKMVKEAEEVLTRPDTVRREGPPLFRESVEIPFELSESGQKLPILPELQRALDADSVRRLEIAKTLFTDKELKAQPALERAKLLIQAKQLNKRVTPVETEAFLNSDLAREVFEPLINKHYGAAANILKKGDLIQAFDSPEPILRKLKTEEIREGGPRFLTESELLDVFVNVVKDHSVQRLRSKRARDHIIARIRTGRTRTGKRIRRRGAKLDRPPLTGIKATTIEGLLKDMGTRHYKEQALHYRIKDPDTGIEVNLLTEMMDTMKELPQEVVRPMVADAMMRVADEVAHNTQQARLRGSLLDDIDFWNMQEATSASLADQMVIDVAVNNHPLPVIMINKVKPKDVAAFIAEGKPRYVEDLVRRGMDEALAGRAIDILSSRVKNNYGPISKKFPALEEAMPKSFAEGVNVTTQGMEMEPGFGPIGVTAIHKGFQGSAGWFLESLAAKRSGLEGRALRVMKANLTILNPATIIHNFGANWLVMALKKSMHPLEIMNELRVSNKLWRQYKAGTLDNPELVRRISALERTGINTTALVEAEWGSLDLSGAEGLARKAIYGTYGKGVEAAGKFYSWGDNIFKFNEGIRNSMIIGERLAAVEPGKHLVLDITKSSSVKATKSADGKSWTLERYSPRQKTKTTTDVHPEMLDDMVARAAYLPAERMFVNYEHVPNWIYALRATKLGGFVSPFPTWFHQTMDIFLPRSMGGKKGLTHELVFGDAGVSTPSNSPAVNAMQLKSAVEVSGRRIFAHAAMRAELLSQDEEGLRQMTKWLPKNQGMILIDRLSAPSGYYNFVDIEQMNSTIATETLFRVGVDAFVTIAQKMDPAWSADALYPAILPPWEDAGDADFELKDYPEDERLQILARRKLWAKLQNKEVATGKDYFTLLALSGHPLMQALSEIDKADRSGMNKDFADYYRDYGAILIGSLPHRVLDVSIAAYNERSQWSKRRYGLDFNETVNEEFLNYAIRMLVGKYPRVRYGPAQALKHTKRMKRTLKESMTKELKKDKEALIKQIALAEASNNLLESKRLSGELDALVDQISKLNIIIVDIINKARAEQDEVVDALRDAQKLEGAVRKLETPRHPEAPVRVVVPTERMRREK